MLSEIEAPQKKKLTQKLSGADSILALMAEADNGNTNKRYAVVTGANKGIGLEICRQLAFHGIVVVLTARDEKRGLDALEKLKGSGFSDNLLFHRLDVTDSSSVLSLAEFIKNQFGRLDILVNSAGVLGTNFDIDAVIAIIGVNNVGLLGTNFDTNARIAAVGPGRDQNIGNKTETQSYESAIECLQINYYGAKRMVEALVPLLQMSKSPRIVNVSSTMGKYIPGESIKGILNDENNLTEERIDELLNQFLKDFQEGSLQAKGWPSFFSAYIVSKAAMNAYTRVVAKKHPNFKINCVCPGYVKTEINSNTGVLTVEEGAESPVRLALLPDDGPSGLFFYRKEVSSLFEGN